jgi:hypothetical protein
MGNTLDYVYEVERDTLTIWGGERGSPAYYKGRFSDDGNTCAGRLGVPGWRRLRVDDDQGRLALRSLPEPELVRLGLGPLRRLP